MRYLFNVAKGIIRSVFIWCVYSGWVKRQRGEDSGSVEYDCDCDCDCDCALLGGSKTT